MEKTYQIGVEPAEVRDHGKVRFGAAINIPTWLWYFLTHFRAVIGNLV